MCLTGKIHSLCVWVLKISAEYKVFSFISDIRFSWRLKYVKLCVRAGPTWEQYLCHLCHISCSLQRRCGRARRHRRSRSNQELLWLWWWSDPGRSPAVLHSSWWISPPTTLCFRAEEHMPPSIHTHTHTTTRTQKNIYIWLQQFYRLLINSVSFISCLKIKCSEN